MSTTAAKAEQRPPIDVQPDGVKGTQPQTSASLTVNLEALGDNESMGSDDAVADEDDEMNEIHEPPKPPPPPTNTRSPRRAGLRARVNLRKRTELVDEDLESEEDDGMTRNEEDYNESGTEGEDEIDSAEEGKEEKKPPVSPIAKRSIKTVRDLPVYAQHAYLASTYGLPSKLPVPMNLLPGLRSRKAPPMPIFDLTKRSRGRHVSKDYDEQKRYICSVDGCDKRFSRGEHLKRHVRSIHTHEKPHQCPYPGCLRGFSRTDNMMQHMRTHDDWPDDETAAKINAEIEKRSTKKGTSGGRKEIAQASTSMPPMPWGMFPPFMNWAAQQKGGPNPLLPIPFPMLPFPQPPLPQGNADASKEAPAGLMPNAGDSGGVPFAAMDQIFASLFSNGNGSPKSVPKSASTSSPAIPPGLLNMPPAPFQFPILPITGASAAKVTGKKVMHTRSSSKADTVVSATTETSIPPSTPGAGPSSIPEDLVSSSTAITVEDTSPSGLPFPPGTQVPVMPAGQQMQMPGGIPWPLPAIAIPIPAGAPLPPQSQLPPNAQIIPDGKGGHTIIIPPPPLPWGMSFPPCAIPPAPASSPAAPPPDATTTEQAS